MVIIFCGYLLNELITFDNFLISLVFTKIIKLIVWEILTFELTNFSMFYLVKSFLLYHLNFCLGMSQTCGFSFSYFLVLIAPWTQDVS